MTKKQEAGLFESRGTSMTADGFDAAMDISRLALTVDPLETILKWWRENRVGRRLGALGAGAGLVAAAPLAMGQEASGEVFRARDTIIKNSGKVAVQVCEGEKQFLSNDCVDAHSLAPGERSWDMGIRDINSLVVPSRHKLVTYQFHNGEWRESFIGNNCGSEESKVVSTGSLSASRQFGASTQTAQVKIVDCPAYAEPKGITEHNTPSTLGVKPNKNQSTDSKTRTPFTDWLKSLQNGGKSEKPKKESDKRSSGDKTDPACTKPWPRGLPDWQKEEQC